MTFSRAIHNIPINKRTTSPNSSSQYKTINNDNKLNALYTVLETVSVTEIEVNDDVKHAQGYCLLCFLSLVFLSASSSIAPNLFHVCFRYYRCQDFVTCITYEVFLVLFNQSLQLNWI